MLMKGRVMNNDKVVNALIKFCDAMQYAVARFKESLLECSHEPIVPSNKSGGCAHAAVTQKINHAVVKCAHCGKEFERTRTTQKFCSAECRLSSHKPAKDAGGQDAIGEKHVCEHCGKEFISASSTVVYCSRRCKEQAKKKRDKEEIKRACLTCGEEFVPKQARSQFCCRECATRYYNYQVFAKTHPDVTFEKWKNTIFPKGRRGKRKEVPTRACLFCGKPYVPTTEEQKYCSKACKFEAHEKEKRERLAAAPVVEKPKPAPPEIVSTPTKDDPRTFEIRECDVCHQKFQAAKGTNVRFCSQCLGHFGYQECVEIAKEEKMKKDAEKNKSPFKVCSLCGTYFTDNTPTKAQIFCERCRQRQINKGKKKRK